MFSLGVTGDREVALKFEEFPRTAHDRLLERIEDLTGRLEAAIRAAEPERSGKLRSETTSRITDEPERIRGRVFVSAEFAKAGALEYGAHRSTNVRAHEARLTHVFGRVADLEVEIAEHRRRPNIEERRFLRGPLEAMRGEILADLQSALD